MTNFRNIRNEEDFEYCDKNSLIYQMRLSLATKQRKIYLYDNVNEDSIFETIYYLNKLEDMDKVSGEKKPIEIIVNSNGGLCYDGLALISLIESMIANGYEIVTTNMGYAFSMGFMIAISGSKRQCYKYARYMCHDVSCGAYGKAQNVKERLEETEALKDIMFSIITNKTNITREELDEWCKCKLDKYFNANEAMERNIADAII